ncbi:MAG: SpaA isopeptide-forming pilin-related protein [Clostridiales bacterium]|nr:SpaA isopeptide-forming pilin-related protein [Clostridiales bacterium]
MTMDARHEVTAYTSRRRRKKRWRSAVLALAAVVVFCTTYALILPAITMAQQTYCGMEEHQHGDDCYETVLLCDREFDVVQPEGHIHTATCYDYEEVLTCGLEECEDTLHEHTDDCYDEEGNLVCTQPEVIEGHTHTEDCYGYEETLICGEEEQQEISEPHRHTEACYTREFVCTKPEHTHSLICYSDKFADLESAGEWEATIPELTGETAGENVALVAKSQIGYTQSGRNYEVDDAGGKHGYTRYGAWYGYPYSEWCAMFASFCLHYAGVEQADVPYAAGCVYWTERLEDAGLYKSAGEYEPKTGDLVFFDTDGDGASDHVGIVTELRGETMETVEGNVGGEVVEKRHELTDEDVFGFGALPQDEAPADVPVMDEPENPTPAEENPDEAMDENPEEKPDKEEPEETTDEEVPELVCGLEEHEHTDTCYGADGELLCELQEHRHSDECYAAVSDEPQEPSYTEEELEAFLLDFTQQVEQFEALEELTDEDISAAQELLTELEQAHQDGQLTDDDYVALYARMQALLTDEYDTIAEPCVGTNWMLLRDSGWFEEYAGAAYDGYDDDNGEIALFAQNAPALVQSTNAPLLEQIQEEGGSNESGDGVSVSKTIAGTDLENVFDITLQVRTPRTVDEVIEEPDMAVVIVMDISNTMNSNFGGSTRYKAAMEAAEQFLDQFAASNSLGVSKVGYVAFNTDAHQIFGLQDCSSQQKATQLKQTMRTKTGKIIAADGYNTSHTRFTNIEAGLKMGSDMLAGAANKNKYIIFLSDGFPTTYISSGYSGYDPYDATGGIFYDHVLNKPTSYGTSYSDKAAIRARNMAQNIKNAGTTIFSIGVEVGGQTIQQYITQSENAIGFSVVDRTGTSYEIGDPTSTESYKNWLRNSIGSGYYYDSTNTAGLMDAYKSIFETIKTTIESASKADWVASDPMPVGGGEVDAVEFIGLFNRGGNGYYKELSGVNQPGKENTASFADNAITWDLKNSGYVTSVSGNTTIYTYTLKYRVRLRNEEAGFEEQKIYDTNDATTLRYRVVESKNGEMKVSVPKELDFPIPSVEGYLGELTFQKQDNRGNALAGAEFTLTHSDNCKICRGDGVNQVSVAPRMAVSGENGEVNFAGIPSGHSYDLSETKVPDGYSKTGAHYVVTVAYDEVTVQVLGPDYKQTGTWGQNEMGVIVNNTYYALPSTGGSGTQWFTVGGLALVLTAGFGLYRIKRRRRREDTASF